MGEPIKQYGASWWHSQIKTSEDRLKKEFWKNGDAIIRKYKAKKDAAGGQGDQAPVYLLNIFWSNVGVMKAALYAKSPKPMVERVWADMNDNVGRVAALILQRCLAFDFMKNNSPMDAAFKLAVEDRLIPGLGCLWMRYEVETETVSVPATTEGGDPTEFEVISEECAPCDYVQWRDLIYPASRTWEEVWFIARRIYMTSAEFKTKFNKSVDRDEQASTSDSDKILPKGFEKGKVTVFEVWCKRTNKVYWLCKEMPSFMKMKEDFLELDDFYPCPKFLMATHTTDDFLPRADYTMVKDQYEQLTELNTRITILEKAVRVVGMYDKKNEEVKRILTDAAENDMIPVEKWQELSEKNGIKGVVDWFPIDMIVEVMEKLKEQKQAKVEEIYELTGISDIMRGATNPRETLGAQELKSQYSSVRLQYLQMEVSTFVRETLIIKGQIMCKHMQPETLINMSNIMQTPDAQYAEQAVQLLQNSEASKWRIDINEEGLALPDYNQEKQTRIEFLTTVGQFLSQAQPITEAIPGALPYMVQMVRWVAAGMRGSNEIQGILDQAINALNQNPPQPKSNTPPPDTTKIQTEQIKQQAETQRVPLKAKLDMAVNKQKADLELRNETAKAHLQHRHDQHDVATDHTHALVEAAHESVMQQHLEEAAATMAAHTKANEQITAAMLENQHANHEFARAQRLQRNDQQHELQVQANQPKPAA